MVSQLHMLFSYLSFGLRGYSVNICLEHALRLKMIYNMLDLCVTLIKIEPYYIINGAVIKFKVPIYSLVQFIQITRVPQSNDYT